MCGQVLAALSDITLVRLQQYSFTQQFNMTPLCMFKTRPLNLCTKTPRNSPQPNQIELRDALRMNAADRAYEQGCLMRYVYSDVR